MNNNKNNIGLIAPINWYDPYKLLDGVNYIQIAENIALQNPNFKFYILNFDNLDENGTIQYYDFENDKLGVLDIDTFSLIHFFDFESTFDRNETLKQKWTRITNKLDIFVTKKIKSINSVKAIKYCINKSYLFELATKNIQVIQTNIIDSDTQLSEVKSRYTNGRFVIKPLNGESGCFIYELNLITETDYEILSKQSDALLIQPYQEEVSNGEFSMLFFRDSFVHAVIKTPVNPEVLLPPKFNINPYIATREEIEFGKRIYNIFPQKLDIFRVDFIKTTDGIKLMEVESVDPFHYVIKNSEEYSIKLGAFYKMLIQ